MTSDRPAAFMRLPDEIERKRIAAREAGPALARLAGVNLVRTTDAMTAVGPDVNGLAVPGVRALSREFRRTDPT